MFDQLFSGPRAVQQYLQAPLLEPRLQYLHSCAAQGASRATLRSIALYQRAIMRSIDLQGAEKVRPDQIRAAAC